MIDFSTAASEILDLFLVIHNIEAISCKPSDAKINSFSNHEGMNLKIRLRNFFEQLSNNKFTYFKSQLLSSQLRSVEQINST